MNYAKAKTLHAGARRADIGKPIAGNTRVVQRGKNYAVRLHNTDILTFRPDGGVVYNTGGWRTVTTKERMNRFGPAQVWSKRGAWLISVNGEAKPYAEGVRVFRGRIVGAARDDRAERKLRDAASKYAKGYIDALYARKIPAPSAGDCFFCGMRTVEGGKPLGEATRNKSHIREHLKESYYVPSLIWNAIQALGASHAAKQTVHYYQTGEGEPWFKPEDRWGRQQLTRVVRRYVLRELGLAY